MSYNFEFAALNEVGQSNWAAPQTVVMPKRSFPEEPKILNHVLTEEKYSSSPYSDKFELSWRIPADNGEPIDRYEIKYCEVCTYIILIHYPIQLNVLFFWTTFFYSSISFKSERKEN